MTAKRTKKNAIIPNGLSGDEVESFESKDEMNNVTLALRNELNMSENLKQVENALDQKEFAAPAADFVDNMPPPPIRDELQPIDYFYFMFGKQSTTLLTNQSNLYSVQKNPNKPSSDTRVESISSVMSRDRFLEIKKYLHVTDNSVQSNRTDINFDRANKVRPLLNIVKENFRKIPKEEKLSIDEQIIPFKGKSIMKQHMPNKPNRWGYKMFLLAGGKSGICYDFIFYTGKNDRKKHEFCTDIVLDLCETVPRFKNHK
ncbi:unnamed protein product, partial [Rotaria sordida]